MTNLIHPRQCGSISLKPKGFGNAVLMAQPFVENESCLVHAGDSCIISKDMDYLKKLLDAFERLNADAAFLVLDIENPKAIRNR